jgi:hypothetical protein
MQVCADLFDGGGVMIDGIRSVASYGAYRWLLRGFLGIAVLQALAMWFIIPLGVMTSPPFMTDFSYYYVAALALRLNPHANLYDPRLLPAVAHAHHLYLFTAAGTFNYPLLLPIALMPLTLLSFDIAARIWFMFNLLLWLLNTALLIDLLWRGLYGFAAPQIQSTPDAPVMALSGRATGDRMSVGQRPVARWHGLSDAQRFTLIFGGFVCVMFAPLVAAQMLGQASMLMLTCFLVALWLLRRARPGLAGALLTIPILIKVLPGFLLVYFVFSRQWRVLLGAIGGFVLRFMAFTAVVGLSGVLLMRDIFTAVTSGVLTTFQNVSLARAPMWVAIELGAKPTNATATLIGDLLIASVALAFVSGMLLKARREQCATTPQRHNLSRSGMSEDEAFGYCWALCTMVLVSPITWEHYLIWLLPAFMLSLGYILRQMGSGLRGVAGRVNADAFLMVALMVALVLTIGDLPFDYDGTVTPSLGPYIIGHPMRPLFMVIRPIGSLLIWSVTGLFYLRHAIHAQRLQPDSQSEGHVDARASQALEPSVGGVESGVQAAATLTATLTAAATADIPWQRLFSVLLSFLGVFFLSTLIYQLIFDIATTFPN